MIIDAVIAGNDSDLDETPLSENDNEDEVKLIAEFCMFVAALFANVTKYQIDSK